MENKHNGLSIAGFAVSCSSVVLSAFSSPVIAIAGLVGLILSFLGRNQAKKNGQKTGLATAGIILGIIATVFVVILAGMALGMGVASQW